MQCWGWNTIIENAFYHENLRLWSKNIEQPKPQTVTVLLFLKCNNFIASVPIRSNIEILWESTAWRKKSWSKKCNKAARCETEWRAVRKQHSSASGDRKHSRCQWNFAIIFTTLREGAFCCLLPLPWSKCFWNQDIKTMFGHLVVVVDHVLKYSWVWKRKYVPSPNIFHEILLTPSVNTRQTAAE